MPARKTKKATKTTKTKSKATTKKRGGAKKQEETPVETPVVEAPKRGRKKAKAPAKKEKAPAKKTKGGAKKTKAPAKKAPAKKAKAKAPAKKTKAPTKGGAKKSKSAPAKTTGGTKTCRYFKLIIDGAGARGRFSGTKPKQAANKAFTSVVRSRRKAGLAIDGLQIPFTIKECTRGSTTKTYNYVGERLVLKNPMKVVINRGTDEEKTIEYKYNNKVMKNKSPKPASTVSASS